MYGRILLSLATLGLVAGCDTAVPDPAPRAVPAAATLGSEHDPSATADVEGRVVWEGDRPEVPPLTAYLRPHGPLPVAPPQPWPNPHAPLIDPDTHGVAQAVVFLRGIDADRSRPWDLPPVRVEQRDHQYLVHQGGSAGRVGFVRVGDPVEMVSTDDKFYTLHARGAAFHSLRFVEPNRPLRRVMPQAGRVELTSGIGRVWMRAHLFVTEHPYYARTDASGSFILPRVPAGDYELVSWLPNWKLAGHDLDPNTVLPVRQHFRPAVEKSQRVTVKPGQGSPLEIRLRGDDF